MVTIQHDGFTLTIYNGGYLDMGLRVEGPDGEVIFDNPCYMGNEQFFIVDPRYVLDYDEAQRLQGELERWRTERLASTSTLQDPQADPHDWAEVRSLDQEGEPDETEEGRVERWQDGEFDDDTSDFVRYMTDEEQERYLREEADSILEGILPDDYAPFDATTRMAQMVEDEVEVHFDAYWWEAVQAALGGRYRIVITFRHQDPIEVDILDPGTGIIRVDLSRPFRWGSPVGPQERGSFDTHQMPEWWPGDRDAEDVRVRWIASELSGYSLTVERQGAGPATIRLVGKE